MITLFAPADGWKRRAIQRVLDIKGAEYKVVTPNDWGDDDLILETKTVIIEYIPVIVNYLESIYPYPALKLSEPDKNAAIEMLTFKICEGAITPNELRIIEEQRNPFIQGSQITILDFLINAQTRNPHASRNIDEFIRKNKRGFLRYEKEEMESEDIL